MDLTNAKDIKELLLTNDLFAKKNFGQNFLINRSVLDKIVETAEIKKTDTVVEVGPGLGVLTQELINAADKVITVELDRTLIPYLENTFKEAENLTIVQQDALKFDPPENYKVVANIPYYITSPLISHFLQHKNRPESLTLLVQEEVGQKLCILEPDMTILSLQTALFGKARFIKKVSAGSFYPAPNVNSAIINIQTYKPTDKEYTTGEIAKKALDLAKKAFSQRRKKISNTIPDSKEKCLQLGISIDRRPETLSAAEWKSLVS
ncbi:MAG: 16S rRNA (adenine(1518)-N(6)/adenine(1519)-N(6))-dimethyltransferase RsmA [Patescibacteria group bacterium]